MALSRNYLIFFFLCLLLLLLHPADSKCHKSFQCGNLTMEFPFTHVNDPDCGLILVEDCGSPHPKILMEDSRSRWNYSYTILNMTSPNKLTIAITEHDLLHKNRCIYLGNVSLSHSPALSFKLSGPNLTVFTCYNQSYSEPIEKHFHNYTVEKCKVSSVYYKIPATDVPPAKEGFDRGCPMIQLPIKPNVVKGDLFDLLAPEFTVEWNVSEDCYKCHDRGGQCLTNSRNEFLCEEGNVSEDCYNCQDGGQCVTNSRNESLCKEGAGKKWKLILGISGGVLSFLLCLVIVFTVLRRRKSKGGYFLSRNISSTPSSKSDIEGGSFYFGIPIFSYEELEKATNKFDQTKELGDGGFGTVYYGKLEDGREVAIKRLYEHNYRRVEQFLNEIKILTCLRHPNLVSLYGCTSRRSRELLLVYEYISNGTVADHLHGERAKEAPLSWPVRMSIAIETATALAYLHNSDIIHRDVKTNNILLDGNFCVKVADFGLSRLFPIDCTHISTAPQGTPGYVDPEYHQCYQLTDRSDVYSFGVVLIELISSMPAVDISRHRHEINLANLAMNRIQRCAFDELIDPSLGYDTDPEVTRMTTSVAELAFRCLQLEKDMRPSMDEVVSFLKEIKYGDDYDFEQMKGATAPGKIPPSPETDDAVLLKSKAFQSSPTAVTDTWISSDSTTASSVG